MKGQFTIIALIMVFLCIIVFSVMYPIIKTFIDSVTPSLDPMVAQFLALMPFFIMIGIVLSIVHYAMPHQQA